MFGFLYFFYILCIFLECKTTPFTSHYVGIFLYDFVHIMLLQHQIFFCSVSFFKIYIKNVVFSLSNVVVLFPFVFFCVFLLILCISPQFFRPSFLSFSFFCEGNSFFCVLLFGLKAQFIYFILFFFLICDMCSFIYIFIYTSIFLV